MATCRTCEPIVTCSEDMFRYSLQEDRYSWVENCPPGFFCGGRDALYLDCCEGTRYHIAFPANADAATRDALKNGLIEQCLSKAPFCTDIPGEDPILYYNDPQTCCVDCPDGTQFCYTVDPGYVLAFDRDQANATALALACQIAEAEKICLTPQRFCLCRGVPAVLQIPYTGAVASWGMTSAVPGMVMNNGRITGTPSTAGTYTVTVTARSASGGIVSQNYILAVMAVTTTTLPDYTPGSAYNQTLTAYGGSGSGNYKWRLVSGTLPPGLYLNPDGTIYGTPT